MLKSIPIGYGWEVRLYDNGDIHLEHELIYAEMNKLKQADRNQLYLKRDMATEQLRAYYENWKREQAQKAFKLDTKTLATIIQSDRTFGVELEMLVPGDRRSALQNLELVNSKIKVGSDGSIRGGYGREIRLGILQGKDGEKVVRAVSSFVRKHGCSVNNSCGLHVHLGAEDIKQRFEKIKRTFLFYLLFDDVLMAMLPQYRRGNKFASRTAHACSVKSIIKAGSTEDIARAWYITSSTSETLNCRGDSKHSSRYCGINLHSLLARNMKTLEVRYHSPTLQPVKILNWVALHQHILDRVPQLKEAKILAYSNAIFFEDKLHGFFKLLGLPPKLERYVRGRIAKFNPGKPSITNLKTKTSCVA